jgi:hypothetical protein
VRPPGASESRGLRLCSCAVPALGHRHTRPGPGRDAGVRAAGCGVRGAGCARWALYAGRGWARQGSSWRCPGSHRAAQLGPASLGLRTQALHEHLMSSIYVAVALWRPSAPPLSTEDKSKCNKIQLEPGIQNKR